MGKAKTNVTQTKCTFAPLSPSTHLEGGKSNGLRGHPTSKGRGRFRARPLHLWLLPSGTTNVLITRLPWGEDLAFHKIVVSVPVPFSLTPVSALACCHGDGSLSLAVRGDCAVRGRAALMFVFEFEGVAASGWGWGSWGRGWWGGEGLCLWRLWRVRSCCSSSSSHCCSLIGCHVLHLSGRCFRAFESVWVKDGLPLLGWFVDGELGGCRDWTSVSSIWSDRHTSHYHFWPCAATVLLLHGCIHGDAVCRWNWLKGQRGRRFRVGTALLESTGPIPAISQVWRWPKAGGMEGSCGEGPADVTIHVIRFTSDLSPLPRNAACASASNIWAENVRLCRAVMFEIPTVPGVNLRQVNAPVWLLWWLAQTLKNVLAWCAVREKL